MIDVWALCQLRASLIGNCQKGEADTALAWLELLDFKSYRYDKEIVLASYPYSNFGRPNSPDGRSWSGDIIGCLRSFTGTQLDE